ncbi:hypothetical protein QR685DRAFT_521750 [Neurospora intermedia]|uniref:rRNA-processing protein FYV7 n=1 Tax=Neurospora intermedia TaxID=5142 RepID=A0ABR3DI51_NEUIN
MAPKRALDEGPTTGAPDKKKAKHGFRVGPENLPDGAWKRKVTKIKKELITKAKVKKQYAKIKAQKEAEASTASSVPVGPVLDAHVTEEDDNNSNYKNDNEVERDVDAPAPIHPSRQILLEKGAAAKATRAEQQQKPSEESHNENEENANGGEEQTEAQRTTTTTVTTTTTQEDDDGVYVPPPMDPNMHPSRLPKRHRKPNYYEKELALAEKKKKQAEARAAEIARREEEKRQRIAEREKYRKQMAKARQPGAKDGKMKLGRQGNLLLDKVKRIVGQ